MQMASESMLLSKDRCHYPVQRLQACRVSAGLRLSEQARKLSDGREEASGADRVELKFG